MKKLGITLLAVLLIGTLGMAKTNYFDNIVVDGTTTLTGAVTFAGAVGITGNLIVDGTLVALDGSTSVRNISAGFTSLEAPAHRFGVSVATYMNVAVAATTGNVAITHVGGSTDTITWTAAGGLTFTGAYEVVGASTFDAVTTAGAMIFVGGITHTGSQTSSGTIQAANVNVTSDLDVDGITNLDVTDIDGATNITSDLTLVGGLLHTGSQTSSGTIQAANVNVTSDLDVDGTANLDIVDIDGATNIAAEMTFIGGITHTGTQTTSALITAADVAVTSDLDVDGITNLDVTDIDDTLNVQGITTFQANQLILDGTNVGGVFVAQYTWPYTQTESSTVFTVPANADIIDVVVIVQTVFDGSGTDLFDLGTVGNDDAFVEDLDLSSAAVSRTGDAQMIYANLGDVGGANIVVNGVYKDQNDNAAAGSLSIYLYYTLGAPGVP